MKTTKAMVGGIVIVLSVAISAFANLTTPQLIDIYKKGKDFQDLLDTINITSDKEDVKDLLRSLLKKYGEGELENTRADVERKETEIKDKLENISTAKPVELPLTSIFDCDAALSIRDEVRLKKHDNEILGSQINKEREELQKLISEAKKLKAVARFNERYLKTWAEEGFMLIGIITEGTHVQTQLFFQGRQWGFLDAALFGLIKNGEMLLAKYAEATNTIRGNMKVLDDLHQANCDQAENQSDDEIESLIRGAGNEVIADARAIRGRFGLRLDARRARRALDGFARESDQIMSDMQRAYLEHSLDQMSRLAENAKNGRAEGGQCSRQNAVLERRIQQLEQRRKGANVGACTAAKLERDAWAAQAAYFRSCPAGDPNGAYARETNRLVSMASKRVGDVCVK